MEWASSKGPASERIEDLYSGIGRSKIDCSRELVTAIKVPKPGGAFGNAYGRISPRNSFCMPIVNAAAALTCERNKITSARLVMGPVAEKPFRSLKAEAVLKGSDLGDQKTLEEAALLSSQEANPRNSCLRGCSDYRKELLRVLVKRVLKKAVAMAQGYSD
jgi:carbon-monoxide dehydrogenase medium subunit